MMYQKSSSMKAFPLFCSVFSGVILALACLATKESGEIRFFNEYCIYHFYVLIAF